MPASKFYPQGSTEGDKPFLTIGWAKPGDSAAGYGTDGGTVTINGEHLDRSGLNRLIKDLRRARDTSYGADG